jgi:hypothetical protein
MENSIFPKEYPIHIVVGGSIVGGAGGSVRGNAGALGGGWVWRSPGNDHTRFWDDWMHLDRYPNFIAAAGGTPTRTKPYE